MPLPGAYRNPMQFQNSRGVKRVYQTLRYQIWTNAATIDANGYLTTLAGPNAVTLTPALDGALTSGGVGTAVPGARNVIVTVTHASAVVVENGVITGTDIADRTITETWSVSAGGTSQLYTSTKAFKTITSVTIISASDASANSNIIGDGKGLGLDSVCATGAVVPILELEDGAAPTAGVLVAGVASHATADAFGLYTPDSTLNGALDFEVWYPVSDPELFGAAGPGVL